MCVCDNKNASFRSIGLLALLFVFICFSCSRHDANNETDNYNDASYRYHYISLDTTLIYANLALKTAGEYHDGEVEALNNLAFVDIIRMNYSQAEKRLKQILSSTDNQFERLVANVQMMRLCQRQSRNKEFYDYYWQADKGINRIEEDMHVLTPRQKKRFTYAKSEFAIILSAYLYYVGQIEGSVNALSQIDENGEIQRDTAQLLNYYYNVGSGNFIKGDSPKSVAHKEFDYLVKCYMLSSSSRNIYWGANALQAMSEHLQDSLNRQGIIEAYLPVIKLLNIDEVEDHLLAGNFARRSVMLFERFGDVYQGAGALRTLSDCYFDICEYDEAISCLNEALARDTAINQAPALISSIREKLSINYSAIDDKVNSDINRNIYLDLQENTRQDRELEARVEQLRNISLEQNIMIGGVCLAILLIVILLFVFTQMRKRNKKEMSVDALLAPLEIWKRRETEITNEITEKHTEILEEQQTANLLLERNVQRNVEQRAKMALINSITPFIDRMIAEIQYLRTRNESKDVIDSRYEYILELTNKINEYNNVLTNWIQLRKGELSLKIESFSLQDVFDIIKKNKLTFQLKGIDLIVDDTTVIVKADPTLTLFMINTIADNARKATMEGGTVRIYAIETQTYVEVRVSDTGVGMDAEELNNVFSHQLLIPKQADDDTTAESKQINSTQQQHGFGLMNCKGIIEKYKKVSQVFSVCDINAESEKGKGSTFSFRLPHGVLRTIFALIVFSVSLSASSQSVEDKIQMYADSAFFCNLQGRYEQTLVYADSTIAYLNLYYKSICPTGKKLMVMEGASADDAAELQWLSDSIDVQYGSIMDMRNETAVAALALHKWNLYKYNNKVYYRLFRENSADPTLLAYVGQMKQSSETKYVALILLILIFMSIMPAYYLLYYRFKVYYNYLVDKLGAINRVLLSDTSEEEKLIKIKNLWYDDYSYIYNVKQTEVLSDVVGQICKALEDNITIRRSNNEQIELAKDELHRLNYEIGRLHVSNNVLDNCFSALKHETMYYPSRIRQLIENADRQLSALYELTLYYKELYSMLSLQAQRQVEANVKLDSYLSGYLVFLLKKLANEKQLSVLKKDIDKFYVQYTIEMQNLHLSQSETHDLFTPLTKNISCLIIRQIIREVGETTNLRGCGVLALPNETGGTNIVITLSKKVKINL